MLSRHCIGQLYTIRLLLSDILGKFCKCLLNIASFSTFRSTAFGLMSGIGRIAAISGNLVFGGLVDVHCAIPMILVAVLLTIGGLCAIKLPNTTGKDIH